MTACPCLSEKNYDDCCGPLHQGQAALTAEALMRSRYSAFVKGLVPYILETVHPDKRAEHDEAAIRKWSRDSDWQGLEIVETRDGLAEDEQGSVEFIARFKEKGKSCIHHELAHFKKDEGRWYFHDGGVVKPKTVQRTQPKVGRNDPCHCGSGKKFKKCCG